MFKWRVKSLLSTLVHSSHNQSCGRVTLICLSAMLTRKWVKIKVTVSVFFLSSSQGESVKYFLDNLEKLGESVSPAHPTRGSTNHRPPSSYFVKKRSETVVFLSSVRSSHCCVLLYTHMKQFAELKFPCSLCVTPHPGSYGLVITFPYD